MMRVRVMYSKLEEARFLGAKEVATLFSGQCDVHDCLSPTAKGFIRCRG